MLLEKYSKSQLNLIYNKFWTTAATIIQKRDNLMQNSIVTRKIDKTKHLTLNVYLI